MLNIKGAECDCHAGGGHQGAMLNCVITFMVLFFYRVNNSMQ